MSDLSKTEELLRGVSILPRLNSIWSSISWDMRTSRATPLTAEFISPSRIVVYSAEPSGVIEAFGDLLESRMGDKLKRRWEMKLVVPDPQHIESFKSKIPQYATYRSLIESSSNPVERLTHIHMANGLIYGGLSIQSAASNDVLKWPTIESYCKGERYHSLIPLSSSYWPTGKTFGGALLSWARDGIAEIQHTAVRGQMVRLLQEITAEL